MRDLDAWIGLDQLGWCERRIHTPAKCYRGRGGSGAVRTDGITVNVDFDDAVDADEDKVAAPSTPTACSFLRFCSRTITLSRIPPQPNNSGFVLRR